MRALTDRQQRILKALEGYAYNSYEICRILNGQDPRDFQGCFFTTREKAYGSHASDRCQWRKRACHVYSRGVDKTVRSLVNRRLIYSIKLRWFDGRKKGCAPQALNTDLFVFYYARRQDLAQRLRDDIAKHLEGGETA